MKSFGSDNNSGVHPKIMKAILHANAGHVTSYGDDSYTVASRSKFKEIFGSDVKVFFVFNGTGANVLGISSAVNSYNSVICAGTAHINVDECGAPEKYTGCKLITVDTPDGKLRVDDIKKHLHYVGDEHHTQPRVVSITQATELGSVYKPQEIEAIAEFVHHNGMVLHMDGARIANAACALGLNLREATRDLGVDILSFGGTKNGMMFGEAVVFFKKEYAREFKFIRKQGMQLCSKMRYISAQFEALLTDDLWWKNASQANKTAKLLSERVSRIRQIRIVRPVEINQVFARVSRSVIEKIREKYFFYIWDEEANEVRWMTAFDTTEEDVNEFADFIEQAIKS